MTIMEIIQERGADITVHRLMDNNMVLFVFYKTLLNGTNLFIQHQMRPQPNLSMDLHKLFVNLFQVLTCIKKKKNKKTSRVKTRNDSNGIN